MSKKNYMKNKSISKYFYQDLNLKLNQNAFTLQTKAHFMCATNIDFIRAQKDFLD